MSAITNIIILFSLKGLATLYTTKIVKSTNGLLLGLMGHPRNIILLFTQRRMHERAWIYERNIHLLESFTQQINK